MEAARGKKEEESGKTSEVRRSSGTFERLEVYRRSYQAALTVHRATRGGYARESDLVTQLRRASRSIPANIAEGVHRSNSAAETKRFLGMALRSGDEVRVWLAFARDLEVIPADEVSRLEREYAEIGAMLYRLWQNWKHQDC